MKNVIIIFALLAGLIAGIPLSAFAQASPTTTTSTPSQASPGASEATTKDSTGTMGVNAGGPATCDFSALKKAITGSESSSGGCGYTGSTGSSQGPTAGKYQFTAGAWTDHANGCPNRAACPFSAVRGNPACCETEECAMNNMLASNMAYAKSHSACSGLIGKTFTTKQTWPPGGTRTNTPTTCTVTMSGLLGAMHLGGPGACTGPASGTQGPSDNKAHPDKGTYVGTYLCKFSGLPVPDDCTPAQQGDPNTGGATGGTLQQIQFMEGAGLLITNGCEDCLTNWWVAGLQQMAMQFTVNMVLQIEMLGTLLDAKHQMETQRLFQQKAAEAHKDYHPSEQMCTFGTFTKDLAATDRTTKIAAAAVATEIMQRELGEGETKSATGTSDKMTRLSQFVKRFCNPDENGGGLKNLCPKNEAPTDMKNRDINYTETIDSRLSLEINMNDTTTTTDEEAVFALVDNLFVHDPVMRIPPKDMELPQNKYHYMNMRSIIAMRGIARNSIANIIALKTETPNKGTSSAPYLKALMTEFGLTPDEIKKYLGDNPSYYAQMELLTKKIYQNPNFYAELYDTPTNVKRIRATMQAVKLMQDRDIQAALQRREMLLSVMLELRLRAKAEEVYNAGEEGLYEK